MKEIYNSRKDSLKVCAIISISEPLSSLASPYDGQLFLACVQTVTIILGYAHAKTSV